MPARGSPKPDCRRCGVCCVSLFDQDSFCDVTEKDVVRLGKSFARRNVLGLSAFDWLMAAVRGRGFSCAALKTKWKKQRSGPLKGAEAKACVALRGSILSRVSCSVYDRRPQACREAVVPGDRACLALRKKYQEMCTEEA